MNEHTHAPLLSTWEGNYYCIPISLTCATFHVADPKTPQAHTYTYTS